MKTLILLTLLFSTTAFAKIKLVEVDRTPYYACEIDADCETSEECHYLESSDAKKSKVCTYEGEPVEHEEQ